MKGFDFKLARLARVRAVQEEIARAKWQAAELKVRQSLALEEQFRDAILRSTQDLGAAQAQPQIQPQHILQARQAIGFMERALATQKGKTQLARIQANKLKTPWQTVRTEVEGLKRLESKARTSFRIEREREEARESDEVAMERAARNNFPLTEERR